MMSDTDSNPNDSEPQMNEPVLETAQLVRGLPATAMVEEIQAWRRRSDVGMRVIVFYLADMHQRGAHFGLGYPSAVAFAVSHLDISPRKARLLLRIGLDLEDLPKIDDEFRRGMISWSVLRALVSVAVAETESRWIERVQGLPSMEVERLVAGHSKGELPRIEGLGVVQPVSKVIFRLTPLEEEMWQRCREVIAGESKIPQDDSDIFRILIADYLNRQVNENSQEDRARTPARAPIQVVVQRCGKCESSVVFTENGEVPLDAAEAGVVQCEGPVFVTEKSAIEVQDPTPPALRAQVLRRDGHRCRSCHGRRGLHVHHIQFRRVGGPTHLDNLLTLCRTCHGLVHSGQLHLEGNAQNIKWTDRRGITLKGQTKVLPAVWVDRVEPRTKPMPLDDSRTQRDFI